MMAGADPFNHIVNTANMWLADVGDALGSRDRHVVHRVLRAWLHSLRDRLPVDAAVKFGGQLPELLRGVFYEDWEPTRVPHLYGVEGFLQRFGTEAGIGPGQAPAAAAAVTAVLAGHMSPGQMDQTLASLPADLREALLRTGAAAAGTAAAPAPAPPPLSGEARLTALENQVSSLTHALRTLAQSLEDEQSTGIDTAEVARAARLADEILIGAY
jgi:uncharacterized protein (DUF2267 family)